jgi:hypothetical protein
MKMQVWIEIGKSHIFHLIEIEDNKQVLHYLNFSCLNRKGTVRWRPTLEELALTSVYNKFLLELCKIDLRPSRDALERILNEDRKTVMELFAHKEYGLYSNTGLKLDNEEFLILVEIWGRSLKQHRWNEESYCLIATPLKGNDSANSPSTDLQQPEDQG